jgi:hypothetical protein
MQKQLPLICPSCQHSLAVKSLICEQCSTTIEGMFTLPPVTRLGLDEQQFVLNFVKSSGSLKEMAKQLGLSYPTVRNMLDDLIQKIEHIEKHNLLKS